MNFRLATFADIPAMSEIRLAVQENVLSNPSRITPQMYEDYLEKLGRAWLCELEGRIIGFCYAASEHNSIWALFVQPGYEGLGAGKTLLRLATQWLFERGAASVTLETAVNTRADRFYLAQGWERGAMKNEIEVIYTLKRPLA